MPFRLENLMVESRLSDDGLATVLNDRGRPVVGVIGLPMPMATFVWLLMERLIHIGEDGSQTRREAEHTNALRSLWGHVSMPKVGKVANPRIHPFPACREAVNLFVAKLHDGSSTRDNLVRVLTDLDEKYRLVSVVQPAPTHSKEDRIYLREKLMEARRLQKIG